MPYVRKEFGEDDNTIAYCKHQQEPAVTSYGGAALRGAVLYRAVAGQLCFGGRTAGIGNGRIAGEFRQPADRHSGHVY